MKMIADMCDGAGPCSGYQVRRVPTCESGETAVILCESCFDKEMAWRRERNEDLERQNRLPIPRFSECELYDSLYCKPWNTGLTSDMRSVCKALETLVNALEGNINSHNVRGDIVDDVREFRLTIQARLEEDGYTVSCMDSRGNGGNKWHVYAPGSAAGKRVRKYREEIMTRD